MHWIWLGLVATACAWSAAATAGAASSPSATPLAEKQERVLVIGRISSGARKQLPKVGALNDHVVSGMADLGVTHGRSVVERTVADMAALMADGHVDYALESLYGAIRLMKEGGGEIVLQEWKNRTPYFHTVLIAHAEADIHMDALHGAHILFEDPGSTSGYFLPYIHLRSKGYRLARKGTAEAADPAAIVYSFAGAETTIAARIARRKATLGALSNNDWRNKGKTALSLRPALRVIADTDHAPRRLVVVRRDLDPHVKQALIRLLLEMRNSAEGRDALAEYKADGFGLITPQTLGQIASARAAYALYAGEWE